MKKTILNFLFALLVNCCFAQEPIVLMSATPYSLSTNIKTTIIDNRSDTQDCGFIQKGAFNRYTPVYFEHGLKSTIEDFLNKKCTTKNGSDSSFVEILIRVNYFRISEETRSLSEIGYFKFAADYFLKKHDGYVLLNSIDTLAVVSAMDVTKKNLQNVSEIIFLIQQSFFKNEKSSNKIYSNEDILNFDNIQKKSIPIYNTNKVNDGFYNSWESLQKNNPTSHPSIVFNAKKNRFYYLKKSGKIDFRVDVEDSIFAICDSGKLYISNGEEFYHSTFENNDFFITAKGNKRIDQASAMGAQIMFGVIGRAIYESSQPNIWYLYKVNFKNGFLMPVKEISIDKKE